MHFRLRGALLGAIAVITVCGATATAQVMPSAGGFPADMQLLQQAQRQAMQRAVPTDALALEGALDPTTYRVGPGDEFLVTVGGNLAQEFRAPVSADGHLLIPEVGRFEVNGLTLSEVDNLVRPQLRRLYRNVPAELALIRPRQFYVHVSGAVPTPGRHLVGPIARLDDALRAAMDDESPLDVLRQRTLLARYGGSSQLLPALRNVQVVAANGDVQTYDLRHYYATGQRDNNPYLQDGDVVVVPAFDTLSDAVHLEGPVLTAGPYDYRAGDTVAGLLAIALGPAAQTRDDISVMLVRADGSSQTLDMGRDGSATGADALRPGDRVVVAPRDADLGTVEILGHVRFPGSYTVRSGITTASEIVELAGGLREGALREAAYLERLGSRRSPGTMGAQRALLESQADLSVQRQLSPIEIELQLQEEAFSHLRLADLDFDSRQYLLSELRRPQRIPISVAPSSETSSHTPLRDGDRIVVPEDPGGILVFGQVQSSGIVEYTPGRRASEYVTMAGGRTSAATDIYIRRAATGFLERESAATVVARGDAVFVNRAPTADTEQLQALRLQQEQVRLQRQQHLVQIGAALLATTTAIITALIFTSQ